MGTEKQRDDVSLTLTFDPKYFNSKTDCAALANVLRRSTRLPKGPNGGIELSFAAVIARRGDIASQWASQRVRLDDQGGIIVSTRESIDTPWDAFEAPIFGFEEPIFGIEAPIFGFGDPVKTVPIDYRRISNLPEAVGLVWRYNQAEQLDAGDFVLLVMIMPGDSPSFQVSPAAIPFDVTSR